MAAPTLTGVRLAVWNAPDWSTCNSRKHRNVSTIDRFCGAWSNLVLFFCRERPVNSASARRQEQRRPSLYCAAAQLPRGDQRTRGERALKDRTDRPHARAQLLQPSIPYLRHLRLTPLIGGLCVVARRPAGGRLSPPGVFHPVAAGPSPAVSSCSSRICLTIAAARSTATVADSAIALRPSGVRTSTDRTINSGSDAGAVLTGPTLVISISFMYLPSLSGLRCAISWADL